MAAYRWKSFNDDGDRPEKPRRYGVTEMKGPNYSLFSRGLIEVMPLIFALELNLLNGVICIPNLF